MVFESSQSKNIMMSGDKEADNETAQLVEQHGSKKKKQKYVTNFLLINFYDSTIIIFK